MHSSQFRRAHAKGFSLIEILVALAILSALAFVATTVFDGSRTKAQVMLTLGKQMGDANIQLKTDTGCYVNNPAALFDPDAALETDNNYCGSDFGRSWSRPYMGKYPLNDNSEIVVDKVGAGVTASFPESWEAGGLGKRYFVTFANVPEDVIRQALIECNNTDESEGSFDVNRCRADLDAGTFDILFDETR